MYDPHTPDTDLLLLENHMAALIEVVAKLEASNTRLIVALEDFAGRRRVRHRLEALRSEMNEYRTVNFNHEVRLGQIESELHIPPST
jgi:hypothetical protein